MNNQAKQWALVVLAFVAGFGLSHYCSNEPDRSHMGAKQAEWSKSARQRFIGPRSADRGLDTPHDKDSKGRGRRNKGEGGPKK